MAALTTPPQTRRGKPRTKWRGKDEGGGNWNNGDDNSSRRQPRPDPSRSHPVFIYYLGKINSTKDPNSGLYVVSFHKPDLHGGGRIDLVSLVGPELFLLSTVSGTLSWFTSTNDITYGFLDLNATPKRILGASPGGFNDIQDPYTISGAEFDRNATEVYPHNPKEFYSPLARHFDSYPSTTLKTLDLRAEHRGRNILDLRVLRPLFIKQ